MKRAIYPLISVLTLLFLSVSTVLWAKGTREKIEEKIDQGAEYLKKVTGDLQHYLYRLSWQGTVVDEVAVGPATLSNLRVNGQKQGVVLVGGPSLPPQKVEVEVEVRRSADPELCSETNHHHLVAGLKGIGPQVAFGSWWGLPSRNQEHEFLRFSLEVPSHPTNVVHEIRFRHAERIFGKDALKDWVDEKGIEPDSSTTLGVIVVLPPEG